MIIFPKNNQEIQEIKCSIVVDIQREMNKFGTESQNNINVTETIKDIMMNIMTTPMKQQTEMKEEDKFMDTIGLNLNLNLK